MSDSTGRKRGAVMATEKQVNFYRQLCEEIGQDADDDFENMSVSEASKAIQELIDLKRELGINTRGRR